MNTVYEISQNIKKEAEYLLTKYNLIKKISKYGTLHFTGSYELDLMYKKDIDISLVNDNISVGEFTELGKELIDALEAPSVYYRNTRITPVIKRPENALYWGIKSGDWWIDLWAMNTEVYSRSENYITEIKSKLNENNRITILQLKKELLSTASYGKEFGSREIYDAVLNNYVRTVHDFNKYLKEHANQNEYR